MLDINKNEYKEIFESIKNQILSSQYRAMQTVNKELILCIGILGR